MLNAVHGFMFIVQYKFNICTRYNIGKIVTYIIQFILLLSTKKTLIIKVFILLFFFIH